MSNFNPIHDDGYFSCLLDMKKFIENSEKLGIRSVKKQHNYIASFIELLLSNREARREFMHYQEIGFKLNKDFKIVEYKKKQR